VADQVWRRSLFVARGVCSTQPVQGGRSLATRMSHDVRGAVLVASRCPQLAGTFTKPCLGRLACECPLRTACRFSYADYRASRGGVSPYANILARLMLDGRAKDQFWHLKTKTGGLPQILLCSSVQNVIHQIQTFKRRH
jgi:hypothetical protein